MMLPRPDKAASSYPPTNPKPWPLPLAQRPWVGLALATATVAALAWLRPSGLGRLVGPLMLACHAIGVVALTTLLAEAFALSQAFEDLRKAGTDGMTDPDAWPRRMLFSALSSRFSPADLANDLVGKNDINGALERAADGAHEAYSGRWEVYRIAAFVPPLLGLVAGWRDVKTETNFTAFADAFQPLAVAWVEAGIWLALATWLSARSRGLVEAWLDLAERLARPSSPLVAEALGGARVEAEALGPAARERPTPRTDPPAFDGPVRALREEELEKEPAPRPERRDEAPADTTSLGDIFDKLFTTGGQSRGAEEQEDD